MMNMYLLDYAYFLNYFASAKELQAWHVLIDFVCLLAVLIFVLTVIF